MVKDQDNLARVAIGISFPLASLLTVISLGGILAPGIYAKETPNWQAQTLGQDIIDLVLITPALVITSVFVYKGNKTAVLLWGGIILYLVYTFVIYRFAVHFNSLFLIYCFALGLSFYALVYFFYSCIKDPVAAYIGSATINKVAGIYFIIVSVLFYFLWLLEVLPATWSGTVPQSLGEVGLLTNPVHVIDLSVFLPGLFVAGLLVLKRNPLGILLMPVILVFFIFMNLTIGWLALMMTQRGLTSGLSVTVAMGFLALFSLILLIWHLQGTAKHSSLKIEIKVR